METPQSEPTFPVVTVEGLTHEDFETRKRDGAQNVLPIAGGWFQIISIQREANAAVLGRLQALAQRHPKLRVLTSLPSAEGGQAPLDSLIAHFDKTE